MEGPFWKEKKQADEIEVENPTKEESWLQKREKNQLKAVDENELKNGDYVVTPVFKGIYRVFLY